MRGNTPCGSTGPTPLDEKTATVLNSNDNEAFFQLGLMRATSDVPETIIIDHVIEATTLEEVTPPPLPDKAVRPASK